MKIFSVDTITLLLYKKEISFIFSRTSKHPEVWGCIAYMRVSQRSFLIFVLSSFIIRKLISRLFGFDGIPMDSVSMESLYE